MTVMFLDVDGVLNSFGKSPWGEMEEFFVNPDIDPDIELAPGEGFKIRTSRQIGRALRKLDLEIRWLTTWGGKANSHIAHLCALPDDLAVAFDADSMSLRHNYDSYWKLNTVLEFIENNPNERVVWVDDDAIDQTALSELKRTGATILAIRPHDLTGITPEHVKLIDEFTKFSGATGLTYEMDFGT